MVSGQVFSQYLKRESMIGVLNGFGAKGWPGLFDVICRRGRGYFKTQRVVIAELV